MTSLLLIISFLLHIVLLVLVYQLYQMIQNLKTEKNNEIESLFSEFLNELKRENMYLQHQLHSQDGRPTQKQSSQSVDAKSHTAPKPAKIKPDISGQETANDLASLITEKTDKVETSPESQIFQLYNDGMSIEEIAKKTGRGKTEIELLVKLNRNKQ